MSDITFLGLGLMGSAMAESTTNAGYDTAIWNRSESRAESLVSIGAHYRSNPAEAISLSPIVVVCVSDYEAADSFLRKPDALDMLKGRVLIQLSSGSPRNARSSHAWCHEAGAIYLDGAIMVYPEKIGTPESLLVIAGDEDGFSTAEPILRNLFPQIDYLGTDPWGASASDSAILSGELGMILGVLNGVALCEATGLSLDRYCEYLKKMLEDDMDWAIGCVRKIEEDKLEDTGASLEVWADTTKHMIESATDAGYSAEIPIFIRSLFDRAIDRGLGAHDLAALIKVLRPDEK